MIGAFMGERGQRFYELTKQLNVRYIWWNRSNKVIEVWGPYESHRDNHPIDVIHNELEEFIKNVSQDTIGDCNV
jgi:hypothetical protein